MAYEFTTTHTVEFAETDMAGIVHFSNFFRWMEVAEHAFFRSLGFSLHYQEGGRMHGWVRVKAECDFQRPVRYEDELEVHLFVAHKGRRSLGYRMRFAVAGETVAVGHLRVVCVSRAPDEQRMEATEIPEGVAAKIERAPADRLRDDPPAEGDA